MHVFELARRLIDIESITFNEMDLGGFLYEHLLPLTERYDGRVEKMSVEGDRFNVFAHWGEPIVTLSTHQDTVPPFIPSSEDDEWICGRGACDPKGLMACMIQAAEKLLAEGTRNFGLLFVVGEERNSAGAFAAAKQPRGSRFLINGEPTGNRLALGSKGALRYEVVAHGRMAHSAYPELGESAIEKLLDVLADIRRVALPTDPVLGASTLNIGLINGGRAPNVIADEAGAEIMIRLVDDAVSTKVAIAKAVAGRADLKEVICIPALHLGSLEGFETCVVAFTTDIPAFGGSWGQPYLLGPGSIHYAHTDDERVPKKELIEAIQVYKNMVEELLKRGQPAGTLRDRQIPNLEVDLNV
jgi:acetylornithine deacetylase